MKPGASFIAVGLLLAIAAHPAIAGPGSREGVADVRLPQHAFTSGPVRPAARQLAEQLMPRDLLLDLVARAIAAGFDSGADGIADLDRDYPGIVDALRDEVTKVGRAHTKDQLPGNYDRYARAIAAEFSDSEIAELSRFYATRVGQKLIVGKMTGMDLGPLVAKSAARPDAPLERQDVETLNAGVVLKVAPHLDKRDIETLLAFGKTPIFKRMQAFTKTITALEVQIASEPDPDLDAKIERAVHDVMKRFGAGPPTS